MASCMPGVSKPDQRGGLLVVAFTFTFTFTFAFEFEFDDLRVCLADSLLRS